MDALSDRLFLLNIRLLELEPEIWRRFVVPGDITLDRLHDVIQIVMGWQDYHLHVFTIGKKRYTERPESRGEGSEECRYRLSDLIRQKGRTFGYLYDFGDEWAHEITIEDSRYFDPHADMELVCIDGRRACPPEDVGGVHGYMEFCHAMIDPGHEEHQSYREWYGGEFDSEAFELDEVNFELMKFVRWSRNRLLPWRAW